MWPTRTHKLFRICISICIVFVIWQSSILEMRFTQKIRIHRFMKLSILKMVNCVSLHNTDFTLVKYPNLYLSRYIVRAPYFVNFVECHTRLIDSISNIQKRASIPGYSAAKIEILRTTNNVIIKCEWSFNIRANTYQIGFSIIYC